MASNQLSNKKGKPGGQQTRSGNRPESGSQQSQPNFGSLKEEAIEAEGYLEQGVSQVREITRDHEGTAVVVALAAGFGVGLAIGAALASSHRQPKTWRDRLSAEGMGRHMLDRLEGMIPDALADYIRK